MKIFKKMFILNCLFEFGYLFLFNVILLEEFFKYLNIFIKYYLKNIICKKFIYIYISINKQIKIYIKNFINLI